MTMKLLEIEKFNRFNGSTGFKLLDHPTAHGPWPDLSTKVFQALRANETAEAQPRPSFRQQTRGLTCKGR